MAAPPLYVADYLTVGSISALGIGVGLAATFFGRRPKAEAATSQDNDQEEAFLGSRRLYAIPLAVSMFASAVTSTSVVSFTAHFYVYGLHVVWGAVSKAMVAPIMAHAFVPVVYGLRLTSVFQ
ncbi:hypothetical protein V5799_018724, partial [Amblyomma americanum]